MLALEKEEVAEESPITIPITSWNILVPAASGFDLSSKATVVEAAPTQNPVTPVIVEAKGTLKEAKVVVVATEEPVVVAFMEYVHVLV